jgi:hypothetical protein
MRRRRLLAIVYVLLLVIAVPLSGSNSGGGGGGCEASCMQWYSGEFVGIDSMCWVDLHPTFQQGIEMISYCRSSCVTIPPMDGCCTITWCNCVGVSCGAWF